MGRAVSATGVSKRYRLGTYVIARGRRHGENAISGAIQRAKAANAATADEDPVWLWALKDVSFEVAEGEVMGIVGRNGAGKTTLLKILSRITSPTEGRVALHGRVGALLEVGTGFHPELTGRENVYLNGAILGMSKKEITGRFDEIVDFAEIPRFIDTPVKRYSSGMYVRLAFAVAAHFEPEILVVDEVLSVGDAAFQRKCLGRMNEVAAEGRTVLFVSHNLPAVRRLCTSAMLLEQGTVSFIGDVGECLRLYLDATVEHAASEVDLTQVDQQGTGELTFSSVAVKDRNGNATAVIPLTEPFQIEIRFHAHRAIRDLLIGVGIHGRDEVPLFSTHWHDFGHHEVSVDEGTYSTRVTVDPNYLRHGRYTISLGARARTRKPLARVEGACAFEIAEVVLEDDVHYDHRLGDMFVPMRWDLPARESDR